MGTSIYARKIVDVKSSSRKNFDRYCAHKIFFLTNKIIIIHKMTNAVHFPTCTIVDASDDHSTYQNARFVGHRAITLAFLGKKLKNKSVAVSASTFSDNQWASRYVYSRVRSLWSKGNSPSSKRYTTSGINFVHPLEDFDSRDDENESFDTTFLHPFYVRTCPVPKCPVPPESRPMYGIDFAHPPEILDSRDDDHETFDSDSLRSCSFQTISCPDPVPKGPVPICTVRKLRPKMQVTDEPLSFDGQGVSDDIDGFRCDDLKDESNATLMTKGFQLESPNIEGCDTCPPPSTPRLEPPQSPHREIIFFLSSYFEHDLSHSPSTTGPSSRGGAGVAIELDEFGEEWEMWIDEDDVFGQCPR